MTGVYRHTIDTKGRLFIPAKIKEELGDVFYVTMSTEPCLSAYSLDRWEKLMEKYNSLSLVKQRAMRPLFSHAAKVELDTQGRILIPQELRDKAGLAKSVAVVGSGGSAEIWDEARWNAVDDVEATPENLTAILTELDF